MTFDFENEKYRYEFEFRKTPQDGPYVLCITRRQDESRGSVATGLPIRNGGVKWIPYYVKALHLTPEAMQYVDRLMQLKVFW